MAMVLDPMIKIVAIVGIGLLILLVALGYYLFRPLARKPTPARFHCYDLTRGSYVPLDAPPRAFGVGLSYAAHIEETASKFDPDAPPPIFRKDASALVRTGATVVMPDADALLAAAEALEPGLGVALREEHRDLSALLDYEGEMGFVLLEEVDPASLDDPEFAPRLGFFVGNDVSARTLAILGEGQPNRFDYWGVSKSFPGFMPVTDRAWVPDEAKPNGIPCVVIETTVDDEVRQQKSTDNLIYTPVQMLRFIRDKYPDTPLSSGTLVLTGTPGGVAMKTPRWLARLGDLMGLSRFKKLAAKLHGDTSRFLRPGDHVVVRGEALGEVRIVIADGAAGSKGGSGF
jgi:2-keto-4-pentenoate hydratase/2-oxohepta-3-ene-1,7-dioic acid hydratase in catechol pathway